jgi:hypothetical protein
LQVIDYGDKRQRKDDAAELIGDLKLAVIRDCQGGAGIVVQELDDAGDCRSVSRHKVTHLETSRSASSLPRVLT